MAKKKLKLNRTVQTTVLAVLIVVIVPIAYVALFTAGVVSNVNRQVESTTFVRGYNTQDECESEMRVACEQVTTEASDRFWVAVSE